MTGSFVLHVKTIVNMNTSLCESYRDTPLQLHHITPIDFRSIDILPDSHRWPALDDLKWCKEPIPVIDLKSIHVVNMLNIACREWGIFQVVGHGVSLSLLEEVEYQAMRLFHLPSHVKAKALRSPDGGTGYGMARISRFFDKLMWHEGFTIMDSSPTHDAQVLWPHDHAEFCDVMDRYQNTMKILSQNIMQLLCESLGLLPKDFLLWSNPNTASTALQLNYYPPSPDPAHSMGLAAHTDTLLFTILHQGRSAYGLQIFRNSIGWVQVAPVAKGALLVNLGDLMHILSNGQYPSVMHRAVLPMKSDRLSVAYFYGPSMDSEVSPVRMHSSIDHEIQQFKQFKSIAVKDYMKMKEKYFNDTLSRLANG